MIFLTAVIQIRKFHLKYSWNMLFFFNNLILIWYHPNFFFAAKNPYVLISPILLPPKFCCDLLVNFLSTNFKCFRFKLFSPHPILFLKIRKGRCTRVCLAVAAWREILIGCQLSHTAGRIRARNYLTSRFWCHFPNDRSWRPIPQDFFAASTVVRSISRVVEDAFKRPWHITRWNNTSNFLNRP